MILRKTGAIPKVKSKKIHDRFMVFDTEAFREIREDGSEWHTMRMAVCRTLTLRNDLTIKSEHWFECQTSDSLLGHILTQLRRDKTLYIYAHNIKYDLQLSGILTLLLEKGWRTSLFVMDDPPTFIRLKHERNSIMFVDTFNYWQTSLEKMGEQLGTTKLVMPEDTAPIEEWSVYCRRDVEVLSEYIIKFMSFLSENDLAPLGLTLASQAFRSYRHRFMPDDIIIHNNKPAIALERSAYSGGRVEAFYIGERKDDLFFKTDVNSMYPKVMQAKTAPVELVAYSENIPVLRLERLMHLHYCIADVTLKTDIPNYPYKSDPKLIFPIGEYQTTLHQAELEFAMANDHIREVHRIAIYRQENIFEQYIAYFYRLKLLAEQSKDKITRHQAKIMMNSLYGKFGQRNTVSKIIDNPYEYKYGRETGISQSLGTWVEHNFLGDQVEVRYKQGESAYSFPAIAGAVTSYARLYLWELMSEADRSNVFYIDTDSLIVNFQGLLNLENYIDDEQLGMLKVEDVSDYLRIWGAKDYQFGDTVKHKGVPSKAVQLSDERWEYLQFRGAKVWLKAGLPTGVEVSKRTKRRKSGYTKGIVNADGSVTPIVIG